jgi:hypothetical protein
LLFLKRSENIPYRILAFVSKLQECSTWVACRGLMHDIPILGLS